MKKLFIILSIFFVWGNVFGQVSHFSFAQKKDIENNKLKNHFNEKYFLIDAIELNNHLQDIKADRYSFNFSFSIDGQTVELNMFLSDVVSDVTRVKSEGKEIMFIKDFGIKSFKGYSNNSEKVNAYLVLNDEYFILNFNLNEKNYTFQPANFLLRQWDGGFSDYVLYQTLNLKGDEKKHRCGVNHSKSNVTFNNDVTKMVDNDCKQINLASASDITMLNEYGSTQNVVTYLTNIYLAVSLVYNDEFSYELDLRIVEYYISNSSNEFWPNILDAGIIIDNLENWGGFSSSHQFKQLYTRRDIENDGNSNAVGVAERPGTISVMEDFTTIQVNTVFAVAHEIGHNLNCEHDSQNSNTIMAPTVGNTLVWSNLSINTVNNHVANNSLFPSCPHTWVDYNVSNGNGSFNNPFNNLGSAVNNVINNGVIRIKASTGDPSGLIINANKNFHIQSWNGSAVVGQ